MDKMDECLMETEDFRSFCRARDLNPEDPTSLMIFENYIIDHGGNLDDCQ